MAIKLEVRAETIDALEKRVLAAFPRARRYGDDGSGRSWASKYIAIAALRHRDQDDLWIVVIRTPLLGLLTVVFLAAAVALAPTIVGSVIMVVLMLWTRRYVGRQLRTGIAALRTP